MTPLPYTPFIQPPLVLTERAERPAAIAKLSVGELCQIARIALRVTSPHTPAVVLHRGARHFRDATTYYVGIDRPRFSRRVDEAMRVLEILAHGFHDYAARESICGRGLFTAPPVRGRPTIYGRPMSARERMRRMRQKRRSG